MEKFNKNDLVVVVNVGQTYSTYKEFVEKAKKEDKTIKLKDWRSGDAPRENKVYRVEYYSSLERKLIIRSHYRQLYVIGENGVKDVIQKGDIVRYAENGENIVAEVAENLHCGIGEMYNLYEKKEAILTVSQKEYSWMHDGNGTARDGHCWYAQINKVEKIKDNGEQVPLIPSITDDIHNHELNELKETIKEQTKIIEKLTRDISRKERIQDLLNEAVIDKAKDIAVEDVEKHLKENLDKFIEEKYGVLPKKIELKTETNKKELTGIFHKEFENICRIVKADIPLMLVGSAGAGKNYTLEQVADALDLDFYFSNAVNQEYKLTGFIDANGTYHETQFYQAFTKGGMFFLDEIDASCPECLVILNSAIANRYFDFPTGRVKAHENFRVVCAGNTYGTGADMVYVGRNVLDGATLDRFVVLQFDYDDEVEKQLAFDIDLYNFIRALRKAINDANLRYIVSMRALINSTKLLELGVDKLSILKTTIIKNMQIDDLNTIVNNVTKIYSSEWTDCLKRMCDNVRN